MLIVSADVHSYKPWTRAEDEQLLELCKQHTQVRGWAGRFGGLAAVVGFHVCVARRCIVGHNRQWHGWFKTGGMRLRYTACTVLLLCLLLCHPEHACRACRRIPCLLQPSGRIKWAAVAAGLEGRTDKHCTTRYRALKSGCVKGRGSQQAWRWDYAKTPGAVLADSGCAHHATTCMLEGTS